VTAGLVGAERIVDYAVATTEYNKFRRTYQIYWISHTRDRQDEWLRKIVVR
jgi:hypothetical protein